MIVISVKLYPRAGRDEKNSENDGKRQIAFHGWADFFWRTAILRTRSVFSNLFCRDVPSPMGRVSLGRKRRPIMQRRKICREEIAIRRTVFLVAAGRDSSPVFSAESNKGPPGILPKRPKTGLTGRAGRHHSVHVRSKYFEKSEKKACHASKTSVILTAKPNQTQWRN